MTIIERVKRSVELYNTGLNCKQISKILNVSSATIERDLRSESIVLDKYSRRRYSNRDINHDFFRELLSEDRLYYLGFIYADGNIYKRKTLNSSWRLNIEIHIKDREILDKFNINHTICDNLKKNSTRMEICSDQICSDLQNYGITPRKSLTCLFPNLPDDNIHHFIRGYFDGDGGFSINKKNILIGYICGTFEFLTSLGRYLPCKYSIRKIGHVNSNTYELRPSTVKKEMDKFVDFLYKDAHFFLSRKYIKSHGNHR